MIVAIAVIALALFLISLAWGSEIDTDVSDRADAVKTRRRPGAPNRAS